MIRTNSESEFDLESGAVCYYFINGIGRKLDPNPSVQYSNSDALHSMKEQRAVHESVWLVWLNRLSWESGKSGFTVPDSTIGSNPVQTVRTGS